MIDKLEEDFQKIYGSVNGSLIKEERALWVENASEGDTGFNRGTGMIWEARMNLAQRFDLEEDDPDLERLLDGALELEEDIARRMFCAALEYVKRGYTV